MNNAIYNITLDVHSTVSQTMVDVPLGDNARTINVLLSDGGIPYEITDDCSAHYSFSMPNGVVHYGDCSIAESVISFDLTNDITGAVGVIEGEITVTDEEEHQLTSPRFTLRISDTLYVAGEVESANTPITLPSNTETAGFLLNPSIYKVTLDLHETMSKHMLDLKKGDNLRRLDIVLSDDGDPYILQENDSAVLRVKKPDGTILYNYCSVEDDGLISYNFTSQTSAVTGMLECELTIYDSENHKLTSPTFFLRIANTLYSDSEVESQDEFTALTEAISQTNNLDIAVEKEDHTATVTVTHKDGTESSVEIYDGDPFSGDAWDIEYQAHSPHSVIGQPENVGEALDDIDEYLGTMTPSTIGAVPTSRKINGKALSQDISLNASDVGALPSSTFIPDDSTLVHKAGAETITGAKTFTNGVEISRPTSGPILKLSSSAADTNFILERTNGSQCVLESGSAVGLFGTKTNHPLQVRTNYTNRMTIGTDGSVVLATDVASNSNNNQVATTKWVNAKGYATTSQIPTKTSDLTNDSGFITGINSSDVTNALGYTPYEKPSSGIPKSDMSSSVQASLDLADSSIQTINYDLGAVTLDSSNQFQITQSQYSDILALWNTEEFCSLSITVNGQKLVGMKQDVMTFGGVGFLAFSGVAYYRNSFCAFYIGVSEYLVGGFMPWEIPDLENFEYRVDGRIAGYDSDGAVFPRVAISEYNGVYYASEMSQDLYSMAAMGQGSWYSDKPRYVIGYLDSGSSGNLPQMFILYYATYDNYTYTFKWYSVRSGSHGGITEDCAEIDILTTTGSGSQQPTGTVTTYSIPIATSQLTNDSGFITGISSSDVVAALGYTPGTYSKPSGGIPASDIASGVIPTATSDLTNDSGFVTSSFVPPVSKKSESFFIGKLDSTSTRTVMTAQVDGITELYTGLVILMDNNVAQSNTGVTLNVNNLGAKKLYNNTSDTAITTQWGTAFTVLLYYDATRDSGNGGWVWYYGYDTNTNTIGYQLRTNSTRLPMKERVYRYRLLFTAPDGEGFVPANTSTSTNATSARTPTTSKIDPFGRICYYGATAAVAAGSMPAAAYLWDQYLVTMGYSFTPITMMEWTPVYLKTAPQTDGSVIIDATNPYVQALPTTEDGKVYIFLGIAISETQIELFKDHPVYWYKDGAVRQWTNAVSGGGSTVSVSQTVTSGTELAGITVDNVTTKIYAPTIPTLATVATSGDYDDLIDKPTPLVGDTSEITPTQVYQAIVAGRDISIYLIDNTFGTLVFDSFNAAPDANVVVSNTILYVYGTMYCYQLIGHTNLDTWETRPDTLVMTETDPTVPSWAKASAKPSYTASEVGALASTGGEVTGDITIQAQAGNPSYSIVFQRGTLTDNYNDWKIQDVGGYLTFYERGTNSSVWNQRVQFNTSGAVTATTFSGQLSGTISSSTTATTQTAGDSSTKVATTEFVQTAITNALAAYENGNTSTY